MQGGSPAPLHFLNRCTDTEYLQHICPDRLHNLNPTFRAIEGVLSLIRSLGLSFEVRKWLQHQDLQSIRSAHPLDLLSSYAKAGIVLLGDIFSNVALCKGE